MYGMRGHTPIKTIILFYTVRRLGQIYLAVYDGGGNRIDDGTINQGETTNR